MLDGGSRNVYSVAGGRHSRPRLGDMMRVVVGIDLRTDGHSWLIQRALSWSARAQARIDLVNFDHGTDGSSRLERLETLLATLPEGNRGRAWVDAAAPEASVVPSWKRPRAVPNACI